MDLNNIWFGLEDSTNNKHHIFIDPVRLLSQKAPSLILATLPLFIFLFVLWTPVVDVDTSLQILQTHGAVQSHINDNIMHVTEYLDATALVLNQIIILSLRV